MLLVIIKKACFSFINCICAALQFSCEFAFWQLCGVVWLLFKLVLEKVGCSPVVLSYSHIFCIYLLLMEVLPEGCKANTTCSGCVHSSNISQFNSPAIKSSCWVTVGAMSVLIQHGTLLLVGSIVLFHPPKWTFYYNAGYYNSDDDTGVKYLSYFVKVNRSLLRWPIQLVGNSHIWNHLRMIHT